MREREVAILFSKEFMRGMLPNSSRRKCVSRYGLFFTSHSSACSTILRYTQSTNSAAMS